MIDDTNTTMMMYPSNKTLSIGDKNMSGINIGTGGGAFSTNTIKIGNASSVINLNTNSWTFTSSGNLNKSGSVTDLTGINLPNSGAGITWGNGFSRILDDGQFRICTDDYMYFYTGSSATTYGTERFSILSGSVYVNSAQITGSDHRIKQNIVDVQDDEALRVFRKLQPKTFEWKDVRDRGSDTVYGLIAQDVKEVIPDAVKLIRGYIPNVYTTCPVNGDKITLDSSLLEYDASGQLFPKLKLIQGKDILYYKILSIEGNLVTIDNTFTEDSVFVYGQEVDNFHALDKDAVWMVSAAALQEVDRQLQAEKQKTQTLQEEVQTLKQTCGLLQQNQDQLLSRIVALESKG